MNRNEYGFPNETAIDADFTEIETRIKNTGAAFREMQAEMDVLRADISIMAAIAIAMTIAFGWAMLVRQPAQAQEAPVLVKSEMTKKQVHDLYITKPTTEKRK